MKPKRTFDKFPLIVGACWLIIAINVAACSQSDAPTQPKTPQEEYRLQFLFKQDGCNVYFFQHRGWDRYFVTCPNGTGQAMWTEQYSSKPAHYRHMSVATTR